MDLTENIRLVYTNRFSNPAHEEFYQYTGFSNFGYWYPSTRDGKEASANLVERLLTYIPHKSGTILDVACGQGGTTRRLLAFYEPSKITAINLDEKQLKNAKKNAPGCNFLVMDAAALGFTSAAFDNILCVEAACHFHTRQRFIEEAFCLLKPGGRLLLTDLIFTDLLCKRYEQLRRITKEPVLVPPENFLTSMEQYDELCQEAGFTDVVVEDITQQTWKSYRKRFVSFRWQRRFERTRRSEMRARIGLIIQFMAWSLAIRKYVLVSARK